MADSVDQEQALKTDDPEMEIDHGTLIQWVDEADEGTSDSRDMAQKCRAYYDGDQWTDDEKKKLQAQKQAATVVNRIKPKIDGLCGMERANRTTAKAYPRTPQHDKAAQAATESIRFCLQDNDYNSTRSMVWDNLTVEGTGGCEVNVGEQKDGKLKIEINWISWDRLIYDPRSQRRDFGDSRYMGQYIWLDYDLALARFPEGRDVMEAMISGSSTYEDKPRWLDTKRKRVKVVELYFLDAGDVWYACFTRGGLLKPMQKSPYVNEEGETEWPYEYASLFVSGNGDRYGAAYQYLDVQDEINKRRSKALHLMSVRQVMWERGAVEDINVARRELAKPDGVVEITPGMIFEVLKTNDMAAAQMNLLTEAKQEIDAVGFSAAASGKESRNMSGVALRNREAASQTELAPMFDVLKNLDVRVYRKVWNRIKQYWTEETWIRVTDDPANLRWVGLNAPITKGQQMIEQAQTQGAKPEQLQMLQQQLQADPSMQEVVDTQNDVAELDVDIVIDDAPDSVTVQQEEFTALAEMVKSGIPIPPAAIIQASSLKDKEKIIKDMAQQGQVPPQLQEQMQKMQEEMQKLQQENQALKQDQSIEGAKLQAKAQSDQQAMVLKAQEQQEELRLERERAAAEIQLAREKATAEIELQRAKAEAELALKGVEIEGQREADTAKLELQRDSQTKEHALKRDQMKNDQTAKDEKTSMPDIVKTLEKIGAHFEQSNKPKPATKKKIRLIKENGQTVGAEVEG